MSPILPINLVEPYPNVEDRLPRESHKLKTPGSIPGFGTKMTIKEALEFLQRVSYKPNTKLSFWSQEESYGYYQHTIVASMEVFNLPDSTTGEPTSITFTQRWNALNVCHSGKDYLMHVLEQFFMEWERHEMYEWFRIDGSMVRDPHAQKT